MWPIIQKYVLPEYVKVASLIDTTHTSIPEVPIKLVPNEIMKEKNQVPREIIDDAK